MNETSINTTLSRKSLRNWIAYHRIWGYLPALRPICAVRPSHESFGMG
jgi:hypothetical protein